MLEPTVVFCISIATVRVVKGNMDFLALSFVLVLAASSSGAAVQEVYYVRPEHSPPSICPSKPCLAFPQYTGQPSKFFTTGAVFIFLTGNHTGRGTIYLKGVSGVTLKSESASYVLCHYDFNIVCENVSHFSIEGLDFIFSSTSKGPPKTSILEILNSWNVAISRSTFQGTGNLTLPATRAVNCTRSMVVIAGCHFEGNTGDNGGAIHASWESNVTLTDNIFNKNAASITGGAVSAFHYARLFMANNSFLLNSATYVGGAVTCVSCSMNMTDKNTFQNNTAGTAGAAKGHGGALHVYKAANLTTSGTIIVSYNRAGFGGGVYIFNSHVTFGGSTISFSGNLAGNYGGALQIETRKGHNPSCVTLSAQYLLFSKNHAGESGGAIYIEYSSLTLNSEVTKFMNNSGVLSGGAVLSRNSSITVAGSSHFHGNHLKFSRLSEGGAIRILSGNIMFYGSSVFSGNKAIGGGAIQLEFSYAFWGGTEVKFEGNSAAEFGGAIYCKDSELIFHADQVLFSSNSAQSKGGAVAIQITSNDMSANVSGNFVHNVAGDCGGGIFIQGTKRVVLAKVNLTSNTGSAMCIFYSEVHFIRETLIANNTGSFGGGVHSENSELTFSSRSKFSGNKANFGGGIYSVYGQVALSEDTLFTDNAAETHGGAVFALGTDITLNSTITFISNTAQNGGAVYLTSSATVSITRLVYIFTSHNHASEYGGVIYNEDSTKPSQCNFQAAKLHIKREAVFLPYCFLQLVKLISTSLTVNSHNDFAARDGNFLFGGLFDRCRIPVLNSEQSITILELERFLHLEVESSSQTSSRTIASAPYQLCFCNKSESEKERNCSTYTNVEVYRGQKFTVPLKALDQMGDPTATLVTAKTGSETWVLREQRVQKIYHNCTTTEFQLYSTKAYEELVLYPDGPCHDVGFARAVVNVTFRPCPVGFALSRGVCVCEERLQKYHATCTIGTNNHVVRSDTSQFWVGAQYSNGSFRGLILYDECPAEYCKTGNVSISLQDLNSQCSHKHAGVLCGSCAASHSFLLGSSRCGKCSNSFYLALLLPFGVAGIALVVFLSALRLTVATGMINSVILYANIAQINKDDYFPLGERNILTVFIAWLNFDLGIETCFYDGLDARALIWLQFAFPLYVWVLISLIILTSRYSITVSKLIGQNPVAVLATLLLMSYAKIVKISINAYSFARLDYPDNVTVLVWRKDGNLLYSDQLQLLLTVVTSLVLIFLFLPYTFLLLLGYKLYRLTDRKSMKWLNKLKPLLDSYYAPYRSHTRYWTGFLLLIRCALYVTFTFNSHSINHTAVIITFAAILSLSWISGRIYSKLYTNLLESATYFNLIILSAVTLAGYNSAKLVYLLVGVVFATVIGIIAFHFARLQIVPTCLKRLLRLHSAATVITNNTPVNRVLTASRQVTRTEVCLREPLLDD